MADKGGKSSTSRRGFFTGILSGMGVGVAVAAASAASARNNTQTPPPTAARKSGPSLLQPDPDAGPGMTPFVFRVRNVPAALYKAMGGFANNGVNMVKRESYMLDGSFNATQF